MSDNKTTVKIDVLKKVCGQFLRTNEIKPTTKRGREAIHGFWYGALAQAGEPTQPYVVICLMSGRHEDLVDMEAVI
jgi:hypothetical protein